MPEILDLPAHHIRTAPVFVIGAARSGTSLLCSLFRRYAKVNFGTESQFIVRVYKRLIAYGDLQEIDNLRRLVNDVAEERCFKRWSTRFGFVLDKNRVFEEAAAGDRSYSGVLNAIFHQFARFHGMPRWGDKTPEYNLNLPVLLSLFPDAQFVHIVRDGRDVAQSTFRMSFGATNLYRAAVDWRRNVLLVRQFCASLPARQVATIRYEELLSQPIDTFGRLLRFLGVQENAALLQGIADDIPGQVRADNSRKWESSMSTADKGLFEAIAGDQLRAFGYPTGGEILRPISATARLFWEADHAIRKAVKPRYWSDNLYRISVRLRMAGQSRRASRQQPSGSHSAMGTNLGKQSTLSS